MNRYYSEKMFLTEIFTLWPPIRMVLIYLASLLLLGSASQVFAQGTTKGLLQEQGGTSLKKTQPRALDFT